MHYCFVLCQAQWFRAHKAQLPDAIVQYFEHNEKTAGGRQLNTDLVNSIVMRSATGSYSFDLSNPYIEEYLINFCILKSSFLLPSLFSTVLFFAPYSRAQERITVFEERYLKEAAVGIPKSMMIKKCGGLEAFLHEQSEGQVWKEEHNGKEMWFSNKATLLSRTYAFPHAM
jgi:hypothetical protein